MEIEEVYRLSTDSVILDILKTCFHFVRMIEILMAIDSIFISIVWSIDTMGTIVQKYLFLFSKFSN